MSALAADCSSFILVGAAAARAIKMKVAGRRSRSPLTAADPVFRV
jgi:hypothetical protein